MASHKIILLPGDGIGPEITEVTKKLLETTATVLHLEGSARFEILPWLA